MEKVATVDIRLDVIIMQKPMTIKTIKIFCINVYCELNKTSLKRSIEFYFSRHQLFLALIANTPFKYNFIYVIRGI